MIPAAAAGGAVGAFARWRIDVAWGDAGSFPWALLAINVTGSALLALLPLFAVVRSTPWLSVLLGTGVLGGFTTMSAASAQTVTLLDADRVGAAVLYAGGGLVVALGVTALVTAWVDRRSPEAEA